MTYPSHGKPLIHHLIAIAMSIAAAFFVSAVVMQDAQAADTVLNIPGPAKLSLESSTGILTVELTAGFFPSSWTHVVGSETYTVAMRQIAKAFKQINCPYFARVETSVTPRAARIDRETLIEKINSGNIDYAKHNGQNLPIETPTAVVVTNDIEAILPTTKIMPLTQFVCIPVKPTYLWPKTYAATTEYL
jgi:hypothetical protein